MPLALELAALFRRDLCRLSQQISAFPADERLWQTLPGISNSAGNLALHLEGNLSEYIGRQLVGIPYQRDRPREFAIRNIPQAELTARTARLANWIPALLGKLSPANLESPYPEDVLGQPLSTGQFLLHLYGHLNYHLGQIDYLRRALTGHSAIPPADL